MTLSGRAAIFIAVAGVFVAGTLFSAFKIFRSQPPLTFEPAPRRIAVGNDPSLVIRDTGDIYLLRLERGNLFYELSSDGGDTFGHAVRVNDVDGEVASHAEATPRLSLRGGKPYALWQAPAGSSPESMRLRFARSTDFGRSFTNASDVDPSRLPASQSFFNMNLSPTGAIYIVWLDGRDKATRGHGDHSDHGGASLYLARSSDGGASFEKSVRVATAVCPCCRPSIAFTDDNTVHVAYRKIYDDNVRDVAVATSMDGGKSWNSPVRVADDHWQINGCPHSGPSLAVVDKRLFVSWFTVHDKEQQAYIYLAHSDDQGRSFSDREWLSEGTVDPNHPYLVSTNDRLFAVFQGRDREANGGWGKVRVYLREVDGSGRLSRLMALANLATSAAYPTLAFESPEKVFIAWTEADDAGSNIVVTRGRLVGRRM